jgi:hypothetical protein
MDDEQKPDFRAGTDQLGAMFRDLAPVIGGYYRALIAAGTPHDLASDLIRDWHQHITEHDPETPQ